MVSKQNDSNKLIIALMYVFSGLQSATASLTRSGLWADTAGNSEHSGNYSLVTLFYPCVQFFLI